MQQKRSCTFCHEVQPPPYSPMNRLTEFQNKKKKREHWIALREKEKKRLLLTRVKGMNDRVEQDAVSVYASYLAMLCENQNRREKRIWVFWVREWESAVKKEWRNAGGHFRSDHETNAEYRTSDKSFLSLLFGSCL